MLALAYYREHLLCPCGCGWPKRISMDPRTEFNLAQPVAHRCHIRTALTKARKDDKDRPTPEGVLWDVQLRDPATP